MKRSEVNKKMKELENAGLLDNFTNEERKCLRQLIKHQQEFIIVENNRKETEKSLFKAKGIMPL
jgi:hypothetical protein